MSEQKQESEGVNVTCPFCGEDDFDLVGLQTHLTIFGWCPVFGTLQLEQDHE